MKQFEYKTIVVHYDVAESCNKEAEDGWRPVLSWYRQLPNDTGREFKLLLERPVSTTPAPTRRFKDIE